MKRKKYCACGFPQSTPPHKHSRVENYRLYVLTNMYLSSIQKGIQTAHVVSELFQQYHPRTEAYARLLEWVEEYKTIIVLNGGNQKALIEFFKQLATWGGHPFALFQEDCESLNKCVTAIGILLPEKVWSGRSKKKGDRVIYKSIKDLPLAI